MQQVFIQQTKINLQQQKRNESDTNTLNKSTKKTAGSTSSKSDNDVSLPLIILLKNITLCCFQIF